MIEIWKEIKGFEGRYEVSNLGNVRGVDRYADVGGGGNRKVKGRNLKRVKSGHGYWIVTLGNGVDGGKKNLLVHRLVAL